MWVGTGGGNSNPIAEDKEGKLAVKRALSFRKVSLEAQILITERCAARNVLYRSKMKNRRFVHFPNFPHKL